MSKAKQQPAKQRLEEMQAKVEEAHAEAVLRMLESPLPVRVPWNQYPTYEDFGGGNYKPPYFFTDIRDRTEDRYRPLYENNNDLRRMRARARNMEAMFPVAIGLRDRLTEYVIGKGCTVEVSPKNKNAGELAKAAQAEVDAFLEYNNFVGCLDQEMHRKSFTEGEVLPTLYPEDENVRCELTDPDAILEPANKRELERHLGCAHKLNHWWLGVHTHHNHTLRRDDVTRPIGYHAVFDHEGEQWDYLPASRAEHYKINVGREARRGWGSYEPIIDDLEMLYKIKRNTAVGAAILAAIVMIRQHAPGTTSSSIQNMVAANASANYQRPTESGAVNRSVEHTSPGTVKDIPSGMEATVGPLGQLRSAVYVEVAQFVARMIAVHKNIPEFMISGDASNSNLNSATMAYESFVRSRQAEQGSFSMMVESLVWKVLAIRLRQSGFRNLTMKQLKSLIQVKVTLPDVASQDSEKQARENEILNRNGVKSKRTWAGELGLDYDEERHEREREPKTASEPAMIGGPTMAQNTRVAALSAALESAKSTDEAKAILESMRESGD
jgi:hypothetical protein